MNTTKQTIYCNGHLKQDSLMNNLNKVKCNIVQQIYIGKIKNSVKLFGNKILF